MLWGLGEQWTGEGDDRVFLAQVMTAPGGLMAVGLGTRSEAMSRAVWVALAASFVLAPGAPMPPDFDELAAFQQLLGRGMAVLA